MGRRNRERIERIKAGAEQSITAWEKEAHKTPNLQEQM